MHPVAAALALLLSATPAEPPAVGLTVAPSLGGGIEVGRHDSTGISELEIAVGYEAGRGVRPELALVLGLSPDTYAAIRPGLRVDLPDGPFFARAALDWAHAGDDWRFRWLLAGAGGELRLTSVLGAFAEVDVGLPLTSRTGLGLLARAGFAFRF